MHRNNLHVRHRLQGRAVELGGTQPRWLEPALRHHRRYHAHKDAEIFHVLKSATGHGRNRLGHRDNSGLEHRRALPQAPEDLPRGAEGQEDDSLLPLIYCLDEDDDWNDEAVWVKANPSLGETISRAYLRQYKQATNYGSTEEANFKTKHPTSG